jgi:hypothetical protein
VIASFSLLFQELSRSFRWGTHNFLNCSKQTKNDENMEFENNRV